MPGAVLRILDCDARGKELQRMELRLVSERITVRDLIERRVRDEVNRYNDTEPGYFHGLVQPTQAEMTLNGAKLRQRRRIDADEQCRCAVTAFTSNRFFLFVNDRQVTDLNHEIAITEDTRVQFLKIVPLVGG
jgi:hypothetical protein